MAAADGRKLGALVIAAQSLGLLAKLEFAAGAWDAAVVSAEQALTLAVESDEVWVQAFATLVRAARSGRAQASRSQLDDAEAPPHAVERITEVCAVADAELAAARDAPENVVARARADDAGTDGVLALAAVYADALVSLGRLAEADAFLAPRTAAGASR